jgi:anaerobic ribonucleoside-triphosphate reductase activating protein
MPESAAPAPCLGGLVPFSTVDWPGKLAAVVFVAGCPWRCHYCHNPVLQERSPVIEWEQVYGLLSRRRGLLDGVVFSGGEPCSDATLPWMIDAVRALGYKVGLHTAGIYPRQLQGLLDRLDWVGLDVKSLPAGYAALTGRRYSSAPVWTSLELLLNWGGDFECRTTWSPNWLKESELLDLAQELAHRGVQNYAVQGYREAAVAVTDMPSTATQEALRRLFPTWQWR